MNDLFLYSIRLIGMVAIIYVAAIFVKSRCGTFNKALLIFYFAGLLSYILIGASSIVVDQSYRLNLGPFIYVAVLIASCAPFTLMFLSRSLFGENVTIPVWAGLALLVQLILDGINFWRLFWDCAWPSACNPTVQIVDLQDIPTLLLSIAPSVIAIGFFIITVFYTVRDWRTDLVEQRRQFRRAFTALLGILGIGIVLLEDLSLNFFPWMYPVIVDIDSILITMFFVLVLMFLIGSNSTHFIEELLTHQSIVDIKQSDFPDRQHASPELVQLLTLLNEGVYKQSGLNTERLASMLSLPEYRLRKLINGELGFRNFNTFLNHHRIADACQKLADPSNKQMAILDIALEVGFGSITSFNDAFKKQMNMTPTTYRKDKLA